MNSSAEVPRVGAVGIGHRPAASGTKRFARSIIAQTLLIGGPTAVLLMRGQAILAGKVFWTLVAVFLLRLVLLGRDREILALLVALTPFFNLLRNFAFFNIIVAMFAAGFVYLHFRSPTLIPSVLRQFPLAKWLVAFVCVHYALSFALTGNYSSNLRGLELAGTAFAILIIAHEKGQLAAGVTGLMMSAIAIGIAMLPHIGSLAVERLGIVVMDGLLLGNPVQLGLPLALACLVLLIDSGGWSAVTRPIFRWPLLGAAAALLALTSSRAAWTVVGAGLVVVLLVGSGQRLQLMLVVVGGVVGVQLLLLSPFGDSFEMGLTRTFSEERTVRNRTSGRSDQWIVAYAALTESLGSAVYGHGPGLSGKVYARKSVETQGVEYGVGREVPFHSFYMQVAVEAGLIGLVPLMMFLATALVKSIEWTRRSRRVVPLACLVGYIVIAATVSGYDTVSGVFLGLSILSTGRRPVGMAIRSVPWNGKSRYSLGSA